MGESSLWLELIKQGGFAAVAALAFWFAMKKDRQVTLLYDRLEAKSEKYLEQHNELAKELNETITALTDALEVEVE